MKAGAFERKGFTLLEIMVAMMLLVGVGSLVIIALANAARLAKPAPEKYTAYNVARKTSENLADAVRDDTWNSGNLTPGAHPLVAATYNGVSYTPEYTVVDVDVNGDGKVDYRKTDTKVQW